MLAMADRSRLLLSFHHLSIFVVLLSFIHGHSFGVAPNEFFAGEAIGVKAARLTSNKTQISESYYSIPYCRPDKIVNIVENLGEILRGDYIQNSMYQFQMRVNVSCKMVCRMTLNEETAKEFKQKIDNGYRANMILDKLPLVVPVTKNNDSRTVFQLGYFVGGKEYVDNKEEKYFINNHLSFIVQYHQNVEPPSNRVIGFETKAFSDINRKYENPCGYSQEVADKKDIYFTYDVEFMPTDIKWASRWDTYILSDEDQIHWFPIMKSLMNVLLLSGIVAAGMFRTLYHSISNYNQLEFLEEGQEERGWKVVHKEVFQPPVNPELLSVYVGTGVQIFGTVLATITFGFLGILSPLILMADVVLLWAIMGIFGGFAMARLYRTLGGSEWTKTTLKTASLFPGLVFFTLLVLNVVVMNEGSHGQYVNMLVLVLLWLGLSVPLVFIGSYIGSKGPEIKEQLVTNEIPREIPNQSWYNNMFIWIMIGGLIPFVAVCNELLSTFTSLGLPQFYFMFGVVLVVLIITCANVTILLCYFHLCGEDYRWWWLSYLTAGSSAFYLFIYASFYYFVKLNITEVVPSVLYFGYMLIACFAGFVLTGTIGFYACFWFTRLIYSSVKTI